MYQKTYTRQELRDAIARAIRDGRRRILRQDYSPLCSQLAEKWREQDRGGIAYLHDLALDLGLFDPPPKWPPENLVVGRPGGFIPRWAPTQEDSPEEFYTVFV